MVRESVPLCTIRSSFLELRSISKLTVEQMISCACSEESWIRDHKLSLQPVEAPYKQSVRHETCHYRSKYSSTYTRWQAKVDLELTDLTRYSYDTWSDTKCSHWDSWLDLLQRACKQLCQEFPKLSKPELGCFKDFELYWNSIQVLNPSTARLDQFPCNCGGCKWYLWSQK